MVPQHLSQKKKVSFVVAVKAKCRERHRQPRIVHFQGTSICPFVLFCVWCGFFLFVLREKKKF